MMCARFFDARNCWTVCLCVLFVLCPGDVRSQIAPQAGKEKEKESKNGVLNVFQPAPSDVRRPLVMAERAIAEGRYEDAAYRLGQLLLNESADDPEAQDYFLVDTDGDSAVGQECLKAKTNRMIASLPVQGRQAYELQFGAQARAMMNEALEEGDPGKLAEVIRRFFHTQAGYEASLLAGRLELVRGRPMAAALYLQRLSDVAAASMDFEPELTILLATCWLHANNPEKVQAALVSLKKKLPDVRLRVGDRDVGLFANDAQALDWFKDLIGKRQPAAAPRVNEWIVYRGNAQRNAQSRGTMPIMNYRWLVPTTIDRGDEKEIERMAKQYRNDGVAALPAFQPLAIGDTVLMRTPSKLMGVDFHSGKRVWAWPPWEDKPTENTVQQLSGIRSPVVGSRQQEVHQRVWEDAAHGQISSDGKNLYLLHELSYAPASGNSAHQIMIFRGIVQRGAGGRHPYNQLVSLSLMRQGAAQWIVGGIAGEDEPRLAGAFFLGPPLPLDGRLYALAEFNGEIRLVVLNSENGSLLWQQQLAHVDARTIMVDGARRLAGATPSFDGGVLLCPTGAGALVAVDVATRSLLWGYQYLKMPAQNTRAGIMAMRMRATKKEPTGQRWSDATVTIADGRVLLTAIESNELHCLDLLTGETQWDAQPRENRLYLACVHNGKAVFVGTDQVSAIRLTDGKPAWAAPIDLEHAPSGRGFYSDISYFLPTLGPELLQIDLEQGKVTKRTTPSITLGNLVSIRGQIVSQGPDFLAIFHQADALRRNVEENLAENPEDPRTLTQFGELLLQDGKRDEAVKTLRRALELDPEQDGARSLLVTTLLLELRENFASQQDRLEGIASLIDRPAQRSEYLRLVAWGWQQEGEVRKAFDAYLELARVNSELLESGAAAEMEVERVDANHNVRMDRWIQTRIGELLAAASQEDRAAMDSIVRDTSDKAIASGEMSQLRRFLQRFASHPLAEPMQILLANRLVDTDELLEAEMIFMRLESSSSVAVQGAAIAGMARLLESGGDSNAAVAYYQRLESDFTEVVCHDGLTGRQLCKAAREDSTLQDAWERVPEWPYGNVEVKETAERVNRYPSSRRVYTSNIVQRQGAVDSGFSVAYDQQRNSLVVLEAKGNILVTINLGSRKLNTSNFGLTHARVLGHLLIVSMGNELIALDLLQASRNPSDAILWREDMVRVQPGTNVYQSAVPIHKLSHPWGGERSVFADSEQRRLGTTATLEQTGIYYMDSRELICADPLNGAVIWNRDGLPLGSDLFGDGELIFVIPPKSTEAMVFSAQDGQELGVREIAPLERRWATSGRRVLEWQQPSADEPLVLRLADAWTGEEIWREAFPISSRGTLVGHDEVAVVQPEGRVIIRSLLDDSVRLDAAIESEDQLETVYVLRSEKQYLVVVNRDEPAQPNSPQAKIRSITNGMAVPLVTGRLYAFNRVTGESDWDTPAEIDHFGFPVDQPSETPVVVMLRHIVPDTTRGTRRQHTAVMALDRRDGRVLLQRDDIPAQTYTFDVIADPESKSVTIGLPVKTFRLSFTDDPIPPPEEKDEQEAADAVDPEKTEKPAEDEPVEDAKLEETEKRAAADAAVDATKPDAQDKSSDAGKAAEKPAATDKDEEAAADNASVER